MNYLKEYNYLLAETSKCSPQGTDNNLNIMTNVKKTNAGTSTIPFREILRSIMRERQLTLKQVADLAGVKISTIQNWTEGKAPHDLQAVARLATALGTSFKGLLLGEPENISQASSIGELFEEQELFDGYLKVTAKRLVPRKRKE